MQPAIPSHQRQLDAPGSAASRQGPPTPLSNPFPGSQSPASGSNYSQAPPPVVQQHERSYSQGPVAGQQSNATNFYGNAGSHHQHTYSSSFGSSGAPQLSNLPFQSSEQPPPQQPGPTSSPPFSQPPLQARSNDGNTGNLPPLKPVFGMSLEKLFERDGSAVPLVVYQCIQAVDLFGLEVEGIYRLSGTTSHISQLRAMFDNGMGNVNP